ncbi:MAG: hotdog fold thioesterase [Bacteroidales bacterium]
MISLKNTLEEINSTSKNTLIEQLGIEYLEVKESYVKAKMPVDNRTKQPFDYLHGGASIALAETIASLGSAVLVDLEKNEVRGAAVTANHIGAVQRGFVYAEAKLIHRGSITHVWDIEIKDQGGYRVSVCRITVIVIPKKSQKVKASNAK